MKEDTEVKYKIHSFRNALVIFNNDDKYIQLWNDVKDVLDGISDEDIINSFNSSNRQNKKSISDDINFLIDERMSLKGWSRQSPIFNESEYRPNSKGHWWTLDFSKDEISMEVAFNHGEAAAWNLIKPVLASELNHVEKAIQTSAGIVITATDNMKKMGNFDNAVGSYEKYLQYLKPLGNILTVPMILIGLEAPECFFIDKDKKEISDISNYSYNQSYVKSKIIEMLDEYGIDYQKNSHFIKNRIRVPMCIKTTELRLCVISKHLDERQRKILEDDDWCIIDIIEVHYKNEIDRILEKLEHFCLSLD